MSDRNIKEITRYLEKLSTVYPLTKRFTKLNFYKLTITEYARVEKRLMKKVLEGVVWDKKRLRFVMSSFSLKVPNDTPTFHVPLCDSDEVIDSGWYPKSQSDVFEYYTLNLDELTEKSQKGVFVERRSPHRGLFTQGNHLDSIGFRHLNFPDGDAGRVCDNQKPNESLGDFIRRQGISVSLH